MRGARCRCIAVAGAAGGRADLVGRVRGPGLGPAAAARACAGRDGGAGDHGDRAGSAGLAAARRRAGPRRARPLRAAARRRVRARRRPRARPRRHARRRAPARPRSSPRPAPTSSSPRSSQDAALVGARRASTTTAGSAPASTCDALADLVAPEGLELVLHPHVGTLVETAAAGRPGARPHRRAVVLRHRPPADRRRRPGRVRRASTPTRIGHVHLKDVDARLAEDVRDGTRSLVQATQAGLFRPLGDGDAGIDEVVRLLEQSGYERWLVLEQDIAITGSEPPVGGGPALDVAQEHRVPVNTGSAERGVPPMKRLPTRVLLAVLAVTALVVAACGGGEQQVIQLERVDRRIRRRHAERQPDAGQRPHDRDGHPQRRGLVLVGRQEGRRAGRAKDEGVKLIWSPSNNDPQKEAQLIDAAVSQKVDGLAVSVPNADAIKGSLAKAKAAGIPIITLNSGADDFKALGAITHVGQTETIAGKAAGARLKADGAKKVLCVIHEQSNIGLQQRCDGVKQGFGGDGHQPPGQGHRGHRDDADRDQVQAAGRQVLRRASSRSTRTSRRRRRRRSRARARTRSSRRSTSARTSSRTSRRATSSSPSTSSSTCRATCRSCS